MCRSARNLRFVTLTRFAMNWNRQQTLLLGST